MKIEFYEKVFLGISLVMLVVFAVFLFVPLVAYSYGTVARAVLKLIKME